MSALKVTQKAVHFEKKCKPAIFLWFSNHSCFCNIVTNPSLILRKDQRQVLQREEHKTQCLRKIRKRLIFDRF